MNRLSETELGPVEEHLLLCPACQDRVSKVDEYIATAKAAARRIESEKRPWKQLVLAYPKPLWAATTAALLFLLYFVWPNARGPAQTLALTTMRGAVSSPIANAGAPMQLKLDASGLQARDTYSVDVVDASGAQVATMQAKRTGDTIVVETDPLRSGQYWIRVSAQGAVLREFSLPVR